MRQADLARKHLERRLAPLREGPDLAPPPRGWIRAIRDALGMTGAQLAQRLGVAQPTLAALEQGEVEGTVTLARLRRAAEALDCKLVYALVPNTPLDQRLRERAEMVADRQLARTHQTMTLENQALEPADLSAERARLIETLVAGDLRRLWREP
jgi:predicted DNA-binding mobile mystery protein A